MSERTTGTDTAAGVDTDTATDQREKSTVREEIDTSSQAGFLPEDRMDDLRGDWNDVQASFVDDPRSAVQQAQQSVTKMVEELTQTFSRERSALESQWKDGGEADTEALRVALQRYRSFFNRLLGTTTP